MVSTATRERKTSNLAITSAPEKPVADSEPQQHEIPAIFRSAFDAPSVSHGFWSKVGRYSEAYSENKLKSGFWNERALYLKTLHQAN